MTEEFISSDISSADKGLHEVHMNEIKNHITRKYNLIIKQIDARRESYFISSKHVFTMRGWCLTAFVAYFGFVTNVTKEYYLIHPGIIICFSFWILEAFVRYGMKSMLDNIGEMINLIDIKGVSDFNKEIEEYQIVKDKNNFRMMIYYYTRALKADRASIVWYAFLLICFLLVSRLSFLQWVIQLIIVIVISFILALIIYIINKKYSPGSN